MRNELKAQLYFMWLIKIYFSEYTKKGLFSSIKSGGLIDFEKTITSNPNNGRFYSNPTTRGFLNNLINNKILIFIDKEGKSNLYTVDTKKLVNEISRYKTFRQILTISYDNLII